MAVKQYILNLIEALDEFEAELEEISPKWRLPLGKNEELKAKVFSMPQAERDAFLTRYTALKQFYSMAEGQLQELR